MPGLRKFNRIMELNVEYDKESGVIRFRMPDEAWEVKFTEETGEAFIKQMEVECSGLEHRLLLIDLRGSRGNKPSREFRKWMRNHSSEMGFERTACMIDSDVMRVISKFIMSSIGRLKDTQFFKTEEEALKWLKGEK